MESALSLGKLLAVVVVLWAACWRWSRRHPVHLVAPAACSPPRWASCRGTSAIWTRRLRAAGAGARSAQRPLAWPTSETPPSLGGHFRWRGGRRRQSHYCLTQRLWPSGGKPIFDCHRQRKSLDSHYRRPAADHHPVVQWRQTRRSRQRSGGSRLGQLQGLAPGAAAQFWALAPLLAAAACYQCAPAAQVRRRAL